MSGEPNGRCMTCGAGSHCLHEPGCVYRPQRSEYSVYATPPKAPEGAPESALTTQVGGTHYKDMPIQPIEFITKNELSYPVGCAIKYLCRYKRKGGIQDLEKANHYIDLLIEMEGEV